MAYIDWTHEDEETGDELVEHIPAHYNVCWRCQGEGKHTNPAVDGNGLTAEDMADLDFREDYLRGVYDVTCEECHGARVLLEPDDPPKDAPPEHPTVRYLEHLRQEAEWRREDRVTLFWESGGTMGSRY